MICLRAAFTAFVLAMCLIHVWGPTAVLAADNLRHPDGLPSLCDRDRPWGSEGGTSGPNGVRDWNVIVSECRLMSPEVLRSPTSEEIQKAIDEWKKYLWDTGQLPSRIYAYKLEVWNDRDDDIDLNLGNWHVAHSAYTKIAEGFSLKIPACHKMKMDFASPWPPSLEVATINIGLRDKSTGKFFSEGAGESSILVPIRSQFISGKLVIEPLGESEIRSDGCKIR